MLKDKFTLNPTTFKCQICKDDNGWRVPNSKKFSLRFEPVYPRQIIFTNPKPRKFECCDDHYNEKNDCKPNQKYQLREYLDYVDFFEIKCNPKE